MLKKYITDLKHEFSGYNAGKLLKDILSGITVAAVALPLALAFGVSSGADAAAGLVTAIIGGLVIGLLGGASFQISGPTGAMSAILIGIVAQYGLQGVFVASLAAGVIILLAGILRLGKLVNFIPTSVVMGFTSGIAIIIALGQVDNFFGTHSVGTSALEKLWSYTSVGFTPNWQAVAIGLLVVLFMVFWAKKLNAKVPGSLLAIILATIVTEIAGFDSLAKVGDIPKSLMLDNRLNLGAVNLDMLQNLVSPIVSIAMLGMIESLLCGASASRMKDEAFDADRELIAQGVGNILLPFFGGVPATAAIARTSVHQVRRADPRDRRCAFAGAAAGDGAAGRRDEPPAAERAGGCADGDGVAHERVARHQDDFQPQGVDGCRAVPDYDGVHRRL